MPPERRRPGHHSYGRKRITGGLWVDTCGRFVELANSEDGPGVRIDSADFDTVIDLLADAARKGTP